MPRARTLACTSLLYALTTSACGEAPLDEVPSDLDQCQMTELLVADDASPAERESIEEAVGLWHEAGGPPLLVGGPVPGLPAVPQNIRIAFEEAAPLFFGIYRPEKGDILINRKLRNARRRAITLAHEIGHAFGLAHVTARRSLMNPGNLEIPPGEEEARIIRERRGPCVGQGP